MSTGAADEGIDPACAQHGVRDGMGDPVAADSRLRALRSRAGCRFPSGNGAAAAGRPASFDCDRARYLKSGLSSRQRLRAEAEEECEDGEADAAHGGGPRQKYAIRRPAQTAPSHSRSDTSAVTYAPPDAPARQSATPRHGPTCAITMLTSAAAINSNLVWNAGLRTTCAASALNNRNPMLIASRKPKRDKGSSNCAIGWIGIARPNPSNLKSSARIDPTSITKPRMCRISTAG